MGRDFLAELTYLKQPVWRTLEKYLPSHDPVDHYNMVRDYPSRQGKYLRPGLLLLSTKMLGGSQEKALLLAAAMQASEDWLLIHDDIEDHSLYRRSTQNRPKPTLHVLHGPDLAINAGDALHILMWRILGDAVQKIGGELGWTIFRKFNDILLTTTEGQFLDLFWIRNNIIRISVKDYLHSVFKKCGYYTIVGPLQLGAMAAGQDSRKIMEQIKKWGTPLGYAFQMRDDLNNLTQKSDVMGKEQGGDILEGKRTLMLIHLLQQCSKEEEQYIAAIYRKDSSAKTETEKNYIIQLMEHYGSLNYVAKVIKENCRLAEREFNAFARPFPNSDAKANLKSAIDFVGNRTF